MTTQRTARTEAAQARREEALRIAHARLNERLAAGLPQDNVIFVNMDGMQDPGPDFTPRRYGWLN